MALGTCPECAGKVSTTADACPHCGNTHFRVDTGKFLYRPCPSCGGSGYIYSKPSHECHETIWEGQIFPCHQSHFILREDCWCFGGRMRVEQFEDLRDGSIHEKLVSQREFRERSK
jgi:hypothetical protein